MALHREVLLVSLTICFGYYWIIDLSLMRIILNFMLKFSFYYVGCVGSVDKCCGTRGETYVGGNWAREQIRLQ